MKAEEARKVAEQARQAQAKKKAEKKAECLAERDKRNLEFIQKEIKRYSSLGANDFIAICATPLSQKVVNKLREDRYTVVRKTYRGDYVAYYYYTISW